MGGGQVRGLRVPVHHHGPAPPVRGRGDGPLHAQGHRGHLRGGSSAPATHGAETSVGEGEQEHDRGADEPGPESRYGPVRHRKQRVSPRHHGAGGKSLPQLNSSILTTLTGVTHPLKPVTILVPLESQISLRSHCRRTGWNGFLRFEKGIFPRH